MVDVVEFLAVVGQFRRPEIRRFPSTIQTVRKSSPTELCSPNSGPPSKKNKSFIVDEISKNAKEAILEYKIIKTLKNYLLLDILLVTGRHHQIRVQFSELGTPIRGDIKYGAKRPLHDKSISLHSKEIEFEHPVNKEILVLKCDPPDEFIPKI